MSTKDNRRDQLTEALKSIEEQFRAGDFGRSDPTEYVAKPVKCKTPGCKHNTTHPDHVCEACRQYGTMLANEALSAASREPPPYGGTKPGKINGHHPTERPADEDEDDEELKELDFHDRPRRRFDD